MPLPSGLEIGPYRILSPIGAGGMGEVYLARDSKLGRDVALKVLPEGFVDDPTRLARFRREAQVLGALNHPNIASIYGLEESGHQYALVLEYVEGETLDERIYRKGLPVPEVLNFAIQIAEALEAAHEKGIIHRDLKPANIKITPQGTVKVLDFGLAKVAEGEAAPAANLSQSPTMSALATGVGMILGTAAYMSPEQARGKPVDQRADTWAFGAVLFEMLAGRNAFEGEVVTDTLARILERDPDWSQLPPNTPLTLRKLIQHCLKKSSRDRLQAIGDARTTLQELAENPEALTETRETAAYPLWKKILPWAAAPVFLAIGLLMRPTTKAPDAELSQFTQTLPPNTALVHNYRHGVELSPDGRRLAFLAGGPGNPRRIYVRNLDQWDPVQIEGTQGAANLAFSPDGQWLAFQQVQQIKKVSLTGKSPAVLVENLNLPGPDWGPAGITWGRDGTIVFSRVLGEGLKVVSDSGGELREFTKLDAEANEVSHRLPHFLPDGSAVLFTVLRYTNVTPDWKRAQVWAKSLKTGERKLLLEDAMDARYANGVLVFARQDKLYAVRFDPESLAVNGMPVQVVDGVTRALQGAAAVTWTGAAQFTLSTNGSLVYAPGSIEPPLVSALVWVDRKGTVTPVPGMKPMFRFGARISPDGKQIASSELYVNKDIWILDMARGIEDKATYEGQNAFPIWSPDGSRMAFRSDRASPLRIYMTTGPNSREVKELTPGPYDVPSSWTADGKELLLTRSSSVSGSTDIYAIRVDEPNSLKPVVASMADERFPEISPDGKWLAYISDETGRPELYVQPYPGPGKRVTITNEGAQEPAWSKNSDELFYRTGGIRMMSVRFKVSGADFIPEKPVMLFEQGSLGAGTTVRATYDVAPDGRFLFNQPVPEPAEERNRKIFPTTLRFVLNWTQATERLLSAPK